MTAPKSLPELEDLIGYRFHEQDVMEKARTRIAFLNDQKKCDEKNAWTRLQPLGMQYSGLLSCAGSTRMAGGTRAP
jgi:hypothetical protein